MKPRMHADLERLGWDASPYLGSPYARYSLLAPAIPLACIGTAVTLPGCEPATPVSAAEAQARLGCALVAFDPPLSRVAT